MRTSHFKAVLYLSHNFIRQTEINVLKSKLEGLERVIKGIGGTRSERREGYSLSEYPF